MPGNIPLVDVSECGLLVEDGASISEDTFVSVGKQLYETLSRTGFAYLTNHGLPSNQIEKAIESSKNFFSLPEEEKEKLQNHIMNFGYNATYTTKADKKHSDYCEGFHIAERAYGDDNLQWPNVPDFRTTCSDLAESFKELLLRIMRALGTGMKLKDKEYFRKIHSLANKSGNHSMLRFLNYPPVETDEKLTNNLTRVGAHKDWNTLVLLLQDSNGGLQVENHDGVFEDIPPIPGTIVLNVGDVFETWSRGRLIAANHRVVPPSDPDKRRNVRRSIIYFGQANDDVLMEPLQFDDGTGDMLEADEMPITAGQYMKRKFDEIFK